MFKKYRDVFCGCILILLAMGLYIASFGIKSVALNLIKADFFPRLDAALLAILGIVLAVTGLKKARQPQPAGEKEAPFWKNDGTVSMLETLGLIALYIFALKPAGFIIATFLYLMVQMFVLTPKEKRTRRNMAVFVGVSLVTSFAVYFVFTKVFYLMLPAGILRI